MACRGGWPGAINKGEKQGLLIAREYLNNIVQNDISSVDGTNRNPQLARAILGSYARNVSTLATKRTMIQDIVASGQNVSPNTLDNYVEVLQRLFVIREISAWVPNIRSKSAIRSSFKRNFVDPSIAVAALSATPSILLQDLKTFGFIFESLCVRDLKIYSQSMGGHISYYRDRHGLEADAVLALDNGEYALIEFKLGDRQFDEAALHLLELRDLIIKNNIKPPRLLMIITATSMAYTRPDGIKVIPISCLKN